jgi:hypothetical protein
MRTKRLTSPPDYRVAGQLPRLLSALPAPLLVVAIFAPS